MSWSEYVTAIAGNDPQTDIAAATGVSAPTVSRWISGRQGVDPKAAVQFARAYGRPVLEALVRAGFITPNEADERPSAAPSLGSLTDDELLDEIRQRLSKRGAQDEAQESRSEAGGASEQPKAAIVPGSREWAKAERAKADTQLLGNDSASGRGGRHGKGSGMSDGGDRTTRGKGARGA